MKYKIFKIKKGKERQWRDWCAFLIQHTQEVIETMEEEGLTRELCIIRGDYILYAIEGEGKSPSDREINRLHHKAKFECLESASPDHYFTGGNVLFDFFTKS